MRKKKLKIDQLKIESFVTSVESESEATVKGGWTRTITVTVTIAETIHEVGDHYSWWHCPSDGGATTGVTTDTRPEICGQHNPPTIA